LAGADQVRPSADLTDRLLRVPDQLGRRPGGDRPWQTGPFADHRSRRRAVVGASACAVGLATVVGTLTTVGALSERPRDPVQLLAQMEVADRAPADPQALRVAPPQVSAPGTAGAGEEALGWMRQEGWCAPSAVPDDVHVADLRVVPEGSAQVLALELLGGGHHVRIVEQRGQLAPDMLAQLDTVEVDGVTAHRLPGAEDRLVVQCAETAVMVVASTGLGRQVAGSLPAAPYDTGVLGRVDRGWASVVDWAAELVGPG
ncbi:hypothetical protein PU560_01675, partial [Georgenia sp. 10Sc9-8]|nr:hypothetical protein [Georgenia halotolerans]